MSTTIQTKYGTAGLSNGYYKITSKEEGNYGKRLHRLVFEDFYNIKLPDDIHIHHNDGDKTNNEIWNLIPLTGEEHTRLHHKGKKMSIESRRKMSASTSGENNPNYGKPMSEKTRKKLSDSHKGKILSINHRNAIGLGNSKFGNSTGFLNVSTRKVKSCKQGFTWRFMIQQKDCKCDISSVDLLALKEKVLKKGFEWVIFDKEKAIETCKKYGYDFKELC